MKNLKLFPFERNRYFYGKLLTVRDFEIEQTYNNDKRRLTNRLLHGSGIVSGLQVVYVDEKTVSVEPGLAIDGSGREIVVSSPVTQKLSLLPGFSENDFSQIAYLYIAYDEKGKEPVHSVAKAEEESEYNRVAEGYRLFITNTPPENQATVLSGLFNSTSVLYSDEQVRVLQTVNRYVAEGGLFNVVIKVEKAPRSPKLTFEYELNGENIVFGDDQNGVRVRFEETESMNDIEYVLNYSARIQKDQEHGRVYIKNGSIKVNTGYKEQIAAASHIHEVSTIRGSIKAEVLRAYYEKSLNECLMTDANRGLCLARINLIQTGSAFVIDKVIPVPFGEYLPNTELLYQLDKLEDKSAGMPFKARSKARILKDLEEPQVSVEFYGDTNEFSFDFGMPEPKINFGEVATGTLEVEFGLFPKVGASYFSDEIKHNLGLGPVVISLGLVERGNTDLSALDDSYEEQIHYGNLEVFNKKAYESLTACVLLGATVYPKRGTFRIGVRLKAHTKEFAATVRWWAYRKDDDQ
ncbi:MAG: hypothetical protein ABFD18_05265 [Syntrophomonas sp.]